MSNWKSIAIQHIKPQPPSPPPPCCHAPCWGLPATHRGAWRRETGHCFQHGVVHHLRPAAASCVGCSLSLGAVLTGCPWRNCKWRLLKVNQSKNPQKITKDRNGAFVDVPLWLINFETWWYLSPTMAKWYHLFLGFFRPRDAAAQVKVAIGHMCLGKKKQQSTQTYADENPQDTEFCSVLLVFWEVTTEWAAQLGF